MDFLYVFSEEKDNKSRFNKYEKRYLTILFIFSYF